MDRAVQRRRVDPLRAQLGRQRAPEQAFQSVLARGLQHVCEQCECALAVPVLAAREQRLSPGLLGLGHVTAGLHPPVSLERVLEVALCFREPATYPYEPGTAAIDAGHVGSRPLERGRFQRQREGSLLASGAVRLAHVEPLRAHPVQGSLGPFDPLPVGGAGKIAL